MELAVTEKAHVDMTLAIGMKGRYKLQAVDSITGNVRELTPWFDNLILNGGIDRLFAPAGVTGTMVVGSGSTPPAANNTQLQTLVASSTNVVTATDTCLTAAPWTFTITYTFQFALGAAAGNLTEIGFGWASNQLFSRALIKDGSNNPITITVLPSEYLTGIYEFRLYPPYVDVPTVLNANAVNYTFTGRGHRLGVVNSSYWMASAFLGGIAAPSYMITCSGGMVAVNAGDPTGGISTSGFGSTTWDAAYVAGSFTRKFTIAVTPAGANVTGGLINSLYWFTSGKGSFQYGISPPLPKDNTKSLTISFNIVLTIAP